MSMSVTGSAPESISLPDVGEPRKFTVAVAGENLPSHGPCVQLAFEEWGEVNEDLWLSPDSVRMLHEWLNQWLDHRLAEVAAVGVVGSPNEPTATP